MADDYGSMSARKAKTPTKNMAPTSKKGNYDQGSMGGFGGNKGARNKGSLKNDQGLEQGKWRDTDNDRGGEGFGGGMTRPRGGGY